MFVFLFVTNFYFCTKKHVLMKSKNGKCVYCTFFFFWLVALSSFQKKTTLFIELGLNVSTLLEHFCLFVKWDFKQMKQKWTPVTFTSTKSWRFTLTKDLFSCRLRRRRLLRSVLCTWGLDVKINKGGVFFLYLIYMAFCHTSLDEAVGGREFYVYFHTKPVR